LTFGHHSPTGHGFAGIGMHPSHGSSTGGTSSENAFGCRVARDGIAIGFPPARPVPFGALALFRPFFVGLLLLTANSCYTPLRPDGEIRSVTARDLVRQYRDDPGAAALAFSEQRVRVYVSAADIDGHAVHWHAEFTAPRGSPALVLRFEGRPAFTAPGWIEGHCLGRTPDRGVPGYGFRVVVSGCVVR
jgi:hypothetical protein